MSKNKKVKIMNPKFLYIACFHKVKLIKQSEKNSNYVSFSSPDLASDTSL